MKKVVISLAGLLAAVAFAPEASAIPAFARQTGMACKACHFQHFPLLNSFGRAFKVSGFTMMGAQGKVEDEHLSIPNVLNISALTTFGYESNKNAVSANNILTPGSGGELSLFFGGRVSENIGFMSELAFPGGAVAAKMPMLWDMGNNVRVGLVASSQGPGPSYSFELLNTGAARAHRLMGKPGPLDQHISATSAFQYLGTQAAANGFSVVATGNMGFVNIGKYAIAAPAGVTASNTMNSTYARGAFLFEAGGWDSAVGVMNISGSDVTALGGVLAGVDTRATIVDGQMQGEASGMPVGLYASYGTAPTSVNGNIYNAFAANPLASSKKSFNIAGELGVIPHKATVQLAFRSGRDGSGTINTAAGQGDSDNAVMIGGTYELAQNVEVSLTHTSQSGNAWNTPIGGTEPVGKTATTLLLEALF